ncbi:MAG: helix-turn-helix transcriptional regulator [bacterium]
MCVKYDKQTLDVVFGADSVGNTPVARAESATREWVCDQDHLAVATPKATGLRMSSEIALAAFGMGVLERAVDSGCAVIIKNREEPARTIDDAIMAQGWSFERLAKQACVTEAQVRDALNSNTRTPMDVLAKIAMALDLDPITIGT